MMKKWFILLFVFCLALPVQASLVSPPLSLSYVQSGTTSQQIANVDGTNGALNVVAPGYFELNSDGSLKLSWQFSTTFISAMKTRSLRIVPFLTNNWDRALGRAALANREQLATQLATAVATYQLDGIQLDLENLTDVDRDAYTDFVRLVRQKVALTKEVSVAVAANPNGWTMGWHGSYDYAKLAQYADYLMIMAYDEHYESGSAGPVASLSFVEKSIQYALKYTPATKLVLGIPLYGRYWPTNGTYGGRGIAIRSIEQLIATYNGVVTWDSASQTPKATITIPSNTATLPAGSYVFWYDNAQSHAAKIKLAHTYNLRGIGSWSLGQESTTFWPSYKQWLNGTTKKKR